MKITAASSSDADAIVACLADAFAQDPITRFLLQPDPGYQDRLTQFFSLLLRARIELKMPVIVARGAQRIGGAAMGYSTTQAEWPSGLAEEWSRFEKGCLGFPERRAIYEEVATKFEPPDPHYYLGVIGTAPALQGSGIGTQLLKSFCEASASDPLSSGVYLETAHASNLRFYERAGFAETGRGVLGGATLWCMFLKHERR